MKTKLFSPGGNAFFALRAFVSVLILCTVYLLVSISAFSQARLIKDLNRAEDPFLLEYDDLTKANHTVFFTSLGKELWNTDGTTSGTLRFRMLDSLSRLTWTGTTLYFAGSDGRGKELWKSNGPGSATARVKDINPGTARSDPDELTDVNGILYFVANDGKHGVELWKSNGNAEGTVLVKDIFSGQGSSHPSQLANVNGVLYFSADNGEHGHELWKSDGTAAGTVMLKDINPGSAGSFPESITYMNGRVYFTAFNEVGGRELWRSNGSASGTILLKNLRPGAASSSISNLVVMGKALYFTADDGTAGSALWKSTGSSAGTTMVVDVSPADNESSEFLFLKAVNNNLYFLVSVVDENYLWRSDGTVAGTRQVMKMEYPNRYPEEMEYPYTYPAFTPLNGSIYFFEYYWDPDIYSWFIRLNKMSPEGTNVSSIWVMDYGWFADEYGRKRFQSELINLNNQLIFYGIPKNGQGFKILRSDGTAAGTIAVKDTYTRTLSLNPSRFVTVNGVVYFPSMGDYPYQHVSRTDGTATGTFALRRFSEVRDIEALNDNVYIAESSFPDSWRLWKTDGTKSGTVLVEQVGSSGSDLVKVNGVLFFYNRDGELWKSDGTSSGTVLVKKLPQIHYITGSADHCYLFITNGTGHQELWKSDGTTRGTVRVKRVMLLTGTYPSVYTPGPVTTNNLLFFIGNDGIHGPELWRTDGTTVGTFMVKDLARNDPTTNGFFSLGVFRNNVYFSFWESSAREYALYRSDGTAAGTTRIMAIGAIVQYIPYKDKLLLVASGEPPVLWNTDGSAAGTKLVMMLDGEELFPSVNYRIVNDMVYITMGTDYGDDCNNYPSEDDCPQNIGKLWRTDGTECGTYPVSTGLAYVSPIELLGNTLILGGFASPLYGKELYQYDLANAPEAPCDNVISRFDTTDTITVDQVEGIETPHPNPFTNHFSMRFDGRDNEVVDVKVSTVTGVPVEAFYGLEPNTDYQFGRSWPVGMYILNISTSGKKSVQRVMKR